MVKIKREKGLEVLSNVCRSYNGKSGTGAFFEILNKVNVFTKSWFYYTSKFEDTVG